MQRFLLSSVKCEKRVTNTTNEFQSASTGTLKSSKVAPQKNQGIRATRSWTCPVPQVENVEVADVDPHQANEGLREIVDDIVAQDDEQEHTVKRRGAAARPLDGL